MLNFREELSRIKENKLNRVDLQEGVEDILKRILEYLNSFPLEQLNGEVKVSFYLEETGNSKEIKISSKQPGCISFVFFRYMLSNREDAVKISELLREYFVNQGYKIYNDASSKYAFAILINA